MNLDTLKSQLSPEQFSTDQDDLNTYGKDWTKHIAPRPSAVVFPRSTEDVQKIVRWARQEKVALVPSGGRTGLSGAAIATQGELVVSFEKMNRIVGFDPYGQTVTVEPGVITEQLQNYAVEKGLFFPVDFAARGSSQIGGNISTNAGGIKVVRYGLMRQWVAGLEVVTGSGEVLQLNRALVKNATGYDLRQMFIGAEGTLGFITKATLALTRAPAEPIVFLLAVPELPALMNIFHAFRSQLPLLAFEMFTDLALSYVEKHAGLSSPLSEKSNYYVVAEVEKVSEEALEKAMSVFEEGMENGWIIDGTMSQSAQQARDIWRLREDISEATAGHQPYKNDVSVRVADVPSFLTEMNAILQEQYPQFDVVWFGHIGDGNLHINILKPDDVKSEEFVQKCKSVDKILFQTIERFEGSVSAEHGVGLTKKPFLHHTRSKEELALMKQIKSVFDPDGIMNPGKIFD